MRDNFLLSDTLPIPPQLRVQTPPDFEAQPGYSSDTPHHSIPISTDRLVKAKAEPSAQGSARVRLPLALTQAAAIRGSAIAD